jgi:hypothetical protein
LCEPVTSPRQKHHLKFDPLLGASSSIIDNTALPKPAIKGDYACIEFDQEEYEKSLAGCKKNFHGGLVLNKGAKTLHCKGFDSQGKMWKTTGKWKMVSLGMGFYNFQFATYEDLCTVWATDTVNLKPGILRRSQWTKDFNYHTQHQAHVYFPYRTLFKLME